LHLKSVAWAAASESGVNQKIAAGDAELEWKTVTLFAFQHRTLDWFMLFHL
jgi:hypothetical protein